MGRMNRLGAALCVLALTGCSERSLVFKVVDKVAPIKIGELGPSPVPTTEPTPTRGGGTTVTLRKLQPALSVRGAACLMCHAQVNSNIITDFGFGDRYYFDTAQGSKGFYSDWESSWASAKVNGSVLVPATAKLDRSHWFIKKIDPAGTVAQFKLAEVLNLQGSSRIVPMTTGVTAVDGKEKVIEKGEVFIGAPQESDITSIAPALSSVGFQKVKAVANSSEIDEVDGLEVVDGVGDKYVRNIPGSVVVCSGDVVVKGPLFLNSLQLATRAQGCRLYVSGSVFIRGRITISDVDGGALTSHNIQITSSKLVAMGFSTNTLRTRLWPSAVARADGAGNATARHNDMVAESERIPVVDLVDAGMLGSDGKAIDGSEADVPMSRILLNAPEIHSRYVGEFKGAVVAEIAVFRLGKFSFSFDPVLQDEKVPILPALKVDILKVID